MSTPEDDIEARARAIFERLRQGQERPRASDDSATTDDVAGRQGDPLAAEVPRAADDETPADSADDIAGRQGDPLASARHGAAETPLAPASGGLSEPDMEPIRGETTADVAPETDAALPADTDASDTDPVEFDPAQEAAAPEAGVAAAIYGRAAPPSSPDGMPAAEETAEVQGPESPVAASPAAKARRPTPRILAIANQ